MCYTRALQVFYLIDYFYAIVGPINPTQLEGFIMADMQSYPDCPECARLDEWRREIDRVVYTFGVVEGRTTQLMAFGDARRRHNAAAHSPDGITTLDQQPSS